MNWRNQALLRLDSGNKHNLHYSSPMTLGKKEIEIVRNEVLKLIERIGKIIDPAPNERLVCFNIDWFEVK